MDKDNDTQNNPRKNLTDKDFYDQACSYFYYHAGQRTTMINYFIVAYGAFIAAYSAMLTTFTLASMLIAVFTCVVSAIFFMIDLRNKFDIKKSENVIRQIERDYNADKTSADYPYGVFSNETNIFEFYGYSQRKHKKAYRDLRKQYKAYTHGKIDQATLDRKIDDFLSDSKTVSHSEIYGSLKEKSIAPLSFCIKMFYILCMAISVLAVIFALVLFLNT